MPRSYVHRRQNQWQFSRPSRPFRRRNIAIFIHRATANFGYQIGGWADIRRKLPRRSGASASTRNSEFGRVSELLSVSRCSNEADRAPVKRVRLSRDFPASRVRAADFSLSRAGQKN
jgi:hypothetical protein